ncbi:HAD family hydrolase [Actinosynnema mirum]|uniref:HAD-superfamily hydrolase, subfamily IA, variant 3 n=1 Tax=Actinosynnema mirum (strain ATCC 29888 / DSM 43827 / JCM 3225 / NBRC 14064 / NCIMB 13271 / NRRL B-12336 / IMRU 3971 / 101) TaxID=446462 RepID=C6WLL8_ACTMD|nr:HAD family hydrolase [Actinosynnema mirum]ACU38411.1 HAD-superfamily hydrolase, subfamily IA, variant 3 [Actinosynnema mirum DSM 43827]
MSAADGAGARVRAVLLDLDGTTVDTLPVTTAALDRAAGLLEMPVPRVDAFRTAAGLPSPPLLDRLGLPQGFVGHYLEAYVDLVELAVVVPGMVELARDLHTGGTSVAVVSGQDRTCARALVKHAGLSWWVRATVTADTIPPEPPQEVLARACHELRVLPGEAVLVGDTVADVRAAREIGMRTVAVSWGAGTRPALATAPWALVDGVEELKQLLSLSVGTSTPAAKATRRRVGTGW